MPQPRLFPDYAAAPTPRERAAARAENRAAQHSLFGIAAPANIIAAAPICHVCAGTHHTDDCTTGTAAALAI